MLVLARRRLRLVCSVIKTPAAAVARGVRRSSLSPLRPRETAVSPILLLFTMASRLHEAGPLPGDDKNGEPVEVEETKPVSEVAVRHYVPATEEERHLDRRVNAKLDAVVLVILAISFIVSPPAPSTARRVR